MIRARRANLDPKSFLIRKERVRVTISFIRAILLLSLLIGFFLFWRTEDIVKRLTLYALGFTFFLLGNFNTREKVEKYLNIVFAMGVILLASFELVNWFLRR